MQSITLYAYALPGSTARQIYSTERAPSKSFGITSIIQPPSYVVDQWVPINLHLEGVGL